jgi:hypothetical protein
VNGPLIVILAGAVSAGVGLAWLLLMHARSRLDLVDVVTEPDQHGVRRASIRKIGEAIALGASTFGVALVTVAVSARVVSDGDPAGALLMALALLWGLYLGAWVSRTLLGMLAQARAGAITANQNGGGK